jgi:predicted transcriptional regulator
MINLDDYIISFLKLEGETRTLTLQKDLEEYNYCKIPRSTLWDHLKKLEHERKIKRKIIKPDQKMGITYWYIPNKEQNFVNTIKNLSTNLLIRMAKDMEISTYNQEMKLNMIRNILINRNDVNVPTHFVNDFEYGRFHSDLKPWDT